MVLGMYRLGTRLVKLHRAPLVYRLRLCLLSDYLPGELHELLSQIIISSKLGTLLDNGRRADVLPTSGSSGARENRRESSFKLVLLERSHGD